MNKLSTVAARLAVSAPCFFAAFFLINTVPALRQIKVSIHGWGWGIFIACALAAKFMQAVLRGLGQGLLGSAGTSQTNDSAGTVSPLAVVFLVELANWVGYALALFATAAIAPDLANYSSANSIIAFVVIISAACAVSDVLIARFVTTK